MSLKTVTYSVLGWLANFGGDKLSGYRTYFSIAISLILKVLVSWSFISAGSLDATHVSQTTDAVLLILSGVSDLLAVFFHASTAAPGPLASLAAEARSAKEIREFQRNNY